MTVPQDIPGLRVWLKSDTGCYQERTGASATTPATATNDPVGSWLDQSGGSRHYTAAADGNRPTIQTSQINGKPALRFDGTDDYLAASVLDSLRNAVGACVFVVRKLTATGSDRLLWATSVGGGTNNRFAISQGGSGSNDYFTGVRRADGDSLTSCPATDGSPATGTTWAIQCGRCRTNEGGAGAVTSWVNGDASALATLASTGNFADTDSGHSRIGASATGTQFFDGDMAEILVFNRELNDYEFAQVWEYLGTRYAISLTGTTFQFADQSGLNTTRAAVIAEIWSGNGFPSAGHTSVSTGVADPLTTSPRNLLRVDKHTYELRDNSSVLLLTSEQWVWHPRAETSNQRLAIYHTGHTPDFNVAGAGQNTMIVDLVQAGYTVCGIHMPRDGASYGTTFHNTFPTPTASLNYLRVFAEPVVRAINQLGPSFGNQAVMVGLSGGGWTTHLVQAIDTRIRVGVPIAGSVPLAFDEPSRDWEQFLPDLNVDYVDLYVMSVDGGRIQQQILNTQDSCCFNRSVYATGPTPVKAVMDLAATIGGKWGITWIHQTTHSIESAHRALVLRMFAAQTSTRMMRGTTVGGKYLAVNGLGRRLSLV